MNIKMLFLLSGLFFTLYVHAELIDGPANVRDGVNGKLLFSLEDNVKVECAKEINGWNIIGLAVKAPNDLKDFVLPKDFKLYSYHGEYLGKTLTEVEFDQMDDEYVVLYGYTHKSNIKESSKIESVVEEIISSKKTLTFIDFQNHIEKHKYQDDDQFDWGMTYIFYESWITDPSPGARVRLIFDNDVFIGLIHTRQINSSNYRNYKILWEWSLLTNLDNDNPKIDKIINSYKHFLQSVD